VSAPGATVIEASKTRKAWRTLVTEQLSVILEQRAVRIGVLAIMLTIAALFNLVPSPIGIDSGWMFVVPVAISAIAAGLKEGLLVALASAAVMGGFAGVVDGHFDHTLALSFFAARFALYGITAVVLGAFAEAHYSVQSNLRELASLDPLTKVFNVASFYKELGVLEGGPGEFAVMLVDIDDLKKINDTHGHQAGSEAIQSVANVLRRVVRGSDCLARYGGDEFVLILGEANMAGAQIVINRVRDMLDKEVLVGAPETTLSVSCGVSLFGEDGKSSEELLEAADRRMYRDKQARKLAQQAAQRFEPDIWGVQQTY
jgi:diguanylate cyclase (GGDEF)-like protein